MKKILLAIVTILILLSTIFSASALTLDKDIDFSPSNSNIIYKIQADLDVTSMNITDDTFSLTLTSGTILTYNFISTSPATFTIVDYTESYVVEELTKKETFEKSEINIATSYPDYRIVSNVIVESQAGGGALGVLGWTGINESYINVSLNDTTIDFTSFSSSDQYKIPIIVGIAFISLILIILVSTRRNKD